MCRILRRKNNSRFIGDKMDKKQKIAEAWMRGEIASTDNFFTNGERLYSYQLEIGVTLGSKKVVYDYTKRGNNFKSKTTSQHVEVARRAGAELWPTQR